MALRRAGAAFALMALRRAGAAFALMALRRAGAAFALMALRCARALEIGSGTMDCQSPAPVGLVSAVETDRRYLLERVGDAAVVQLYADGFHDLPLRDKVLVWHLTLAAIAGRDIFYDQRYAHNLDMRDALEAILIHAQDVDPATLDAISRYTKLFWLNTGPHNNLTARKFVPTCTPDAFRRAAHAAAT